MTGLQVADEADLREVNDVRLPLGTVVQVLKGSLAELRMLNRSMPIFTFFSGCGQSLRQGRPHSPKRKFCGA